MRADAQFARELDADRRLRHVAVVQREGPFDGMLRQARTFLVGRVHAFRAGQLLPPGVRREHLLLHHAAGLRHARVGQQRLEGRPFGDEMLALRGRDEHVRREVGQTLPDDAVETVVNGKDEDQRGRADGHPDSAQHRNRVDHSQ